MSGRALDVEGIRFERCGRLGVVTLDQPRMLNALTYPMVRALGRALAHWRADDAIGAVLFEGAGERAFCAGGDIRRVYEMRQRGEPGITDFFRDEYRMNWRVGHFPEPCIALMDGITMGGGVGIAAPCTFRIATERTVFAMPETGIGLFPDVGGSYHLSRLPGSLGTYLGSTGARLGPADCLEAEIATAYVPSARLPELRAGLQRAELGADARDEIDALVGSCTDVPGAGELAGRRAEIDAVFAADSVEAILKALAQASGGWGEASRAELATKSPTSLKVTHAQLRRGADLDLAGALRQEFRLVDRFMAGHDFFEGVRALLIDKDRNPRWRPADLASVGDDDVDAYFAPLSGGDLAFDWDEGGVT